MKDSLNNTSWILESWSINSKGPSIKEITLEFNNNKISGNGEVNNYSGDYSTNYNKMLISNIMSTEMASSDNNINIEESTYFSLLKSVKYFKQNSNKLILLDKNSNAILVYKNN